MLEHNRKMKQFLLNKGIRCTPKYIFKGSLKGTWRLYDLKQSWSLTLCDKFKDLGFTDLSGKPLGRFSGNGGLFSVFTRHSELTKAFIV